MSSADADDREGGRGAKGAAKPKRYDLVVLGASFAGIELLYQLSRRLDGTLKTAVVDRCSRHGYIPLVQERLCARLQAEESTLDTRAFVESLPTTTFIEDEVQSLSPEDKVVTLGSGRRLQARFIVVALGSVIDPPPSLPGHEHLFRHKLAAEFDDARSRLEALLDESKGGESKDGESKDGDAPTIVVVGGGISAVELAGELADLARQRPSGWQPPRVVLASASERLVETLPAGVAKAAKRILTAQGVTVELDARVTEVRPDAVVLQGGKEIPFAMAMWAGGVRPAPVLAQLGLPRTDDGWLSVGPTLQCFATAEPTHPEIFACGDAVRVVGGTGPWPTMQRAIECLWQAKSLAKNLVRLAGHEASYPDGFPPLMPHTLREDFPYGVSLGHKSLVVYRGLRMHVPGLTVWFRRFLMRQYFARYEPLPGPGRS